MTETNKKVMNILRVLEKEKKSCVFQIATDPTCSSYFNGKELGIDIAIEIVKGALEDEDKSD